MSIKQNGNKKYIGSCCGNSFVIFDCRDNGLDEQLKADSASANIVKYEVDSALILRSSAWTDVFIEIFEKDGSESEACGNGTILVSYLLGIDQGMIEMKNNAALVSGDIKKQAISMNVRLSYIIEETGSEKRCLFVKIGEPHIIYLVDDLENFDLVGFGKKAQKKHPKGVNVDAIQKVSDDCYLIRTYERGVFRETKSCGTGSLCAYIAISHFDKKIYEESVEFKSVGGSHWVSRNSMNKNMLKLETLKKFCKIEIV